jgi:Transglycosylase-like domain
MVTNAAVSGEPEYVELLARASTARQQIANEEAAHVATALEQRARVYVRRVAMWDRLAECETGGNWHNGGEYGGGLGIYIGTWRMYGGQEFASRPQWATKWQQITVAERIARDGFGGWGCAHTLGWVN